MTLPYNTIITVAITLAFAVWMQYKNDANPTPFFQWLFKDNLYYLISTLALCVLGIVWRYDLMEMVGMTKEVIYAVALGSGGGSIIGSIFGIIPAKKARIEIKNAVAK
mgnify:FL=1